MTHCGPKLITRVSLLQERHPLTLASLAPARRARQLTEHAYRNDLQLWRDSASQKVSRCPPMKKGNFFVFVINTELLHLSVR